MTKPVDLIVAARMRIARLEIRILSWAIDLLEALRRRGGPAALSAPQAAAAEGTAPPPSSEEIRTEWIPWSEIRDALPISRPAARFQNDFASGVVSSHRVDA